jgi:signal transduction histidine kinase
MLNLNFDEITDLNITLISETDENISELVSALNNLGHNTKHLTDCSEINSTNFFSADMYIIDSSIKIDEIKQFCDLKNSLVLTNYIPLMVYSGFDETDFIEPVMNLGVNDIIFRQLVQYTLKARLINQMKLMNFHTNLNHKIKHLETLNKEKNEILGIAAHDLKNPIFSIQLLGKTIRDDMSLTKEELFEFSSDIVSSCDRIIEIIKQLLNLNSIESGKIIINIVQQSILESINHLIELYKYKAERKNIQIFLENYSDGIALTDMTSLSNIFDNFLSNAIKYSPFDKSVLVKIYDEDNFLKIDISDEGPGIPENELDKLFKRFAKISNKPTAGENSTGLGLSIAKKFSELIKAEIKFSNNVNRNGSTFSVILPKF